MFVFELPEIGEGVVEGEIVRWLLGEGDVVAVDQPLCEVMTDKATVEISSPRAGRIAQLHGVEGDIIKVHTPLVDIDESAAGEAPAPSNGKPAPVPAPAAKAAPKSSPKAAKPAPSPVSAPPPVAAPTTGRALATPAIRSHARDQDVDINRVPGSGKNGRVSRADIDAFVQHPSALRAPPALRSPAATREDERIRIIGLRRKIAEKMTESYRRVPHFTYVDEIDATRLVDLRRQLKPVAAEMGVQLSYIPFLMKALVRVFAEFPTVNAVMDEEKFEVVVRGEVNIGIATDTPAGLYVPVVKNVESKSLFELAAEVVDLAERTRQNKVTLDELQGGTFTITSVGNIGGRFATPIINHPEVAILGVNQIHDRPMVIDGQVVPRKMMYLSPSFDHRVIDGAVEARFVSALKTVLEMPASLLVE